MSSKNRYSLLFTIQSIILIISLTLVGSLTWYNYVENRSAALEVGKEMLEHLSYRVTSELQKLVSKPEFLIKMIPSLPKLSEKPENFYHPELHYFLQFLDDCPEVYSVYLAWTDGDLYQVIKIRGDQLLRAREEVPARGEYIAQFFTTNAQGERVKIRGFFDYEGKPIGILKVLPTSYDPRTRIWYSEGLKKGTVNITPTYRFSSSQELGTTITNTFSGQSTGLVAIDIKLKTLSEMFQNARPGDDGRIVVFSEGGRIIVHEDLASITWTSGDVGSRERPNTMVIDELNDEVLSRMYNKFINDMSTEGGAFSFSVDGVVYVADMTKKSFIFDNHRIVAIAAPESYFTETVSAVRVKSLIFGVTLFALSIPIIIYVSRRISVRLKELSGEADKIKRFELDGEINIQSRIKEVAVLTDSFRGMKAGIRSFSQYVPTALVHRFVTMDTEPTIGGERIPLTILFTDTTEFTPLSETMEPEALAVTMSEYFSLMSDIVTISEGTVDKYIGDSMMAFWNAPNPLTNHAIKACEATLACAKAIKGFSCEDGEGHARVLETRFGLHVGEAVVGNMGSSDRLNYTAMGSTVNLAARLEQLNKVYGTTILVSDAVYNAASQRFLFRPVDRVRPKGVALPLTVYELIDVYDEEHASAAETWQDAYDLYHGERLEEALAIFEAFDEEPTKLTQLYIDRCREGLKG